MRVRAFPHPFTNPIRAEWGWDMMGYAPTPSRSLFQPYSGQLQ